MRQRGSPLGQPRFGRQPGVGRRKPRSLHQLVLDERCRPAEGVQSQAVCPMGRLRQGAGVGGGRWGVAAGQGGGGREPGAGEMMVSTTQGTMLDLF